MIPCTKIIKGTRSVHNQNSMGPLFVWNITPQCNLHCQHCYRDSSSESLQHLDDQQCLSVTGDIKKLNPPIVLLTGGEPLLRNNLFDIIRACKDQDLRVGLSTNGTLIDMDMARKIKSSGVDYVGISIDGTEQTHDEFRGLEGAFQKSWKAIDHLNTVEVKTGIRFTLTHDNKDQLFDILDKSIARGVKRFCLYHLVYTGRGRDVLDLNVHDKREIMAKFFRRVEKLTQNMEEIEVLTTDNHADGVFLSNMLKDNGSALDCIKAHGGCSAGEKVIYLDASGDVFPCQFLLDQSLGNVKDKSLLEIWSNPDNEYLNSLRSKTQHLKAKCGECQYKEICAGCRARAKAVSGDLWQEDPGCYLSNEEINVTLEKVQNDS